MKKLALGPIVALVAALALCASAAPALAANHTITLTGPPTSTVGQPMAIRASGVVAPPEEFWDLSWIEVVEISMKVVPECPPDAPSAGVLAEETGGNILAIALRPYMDEAGNYSNLVGYTPPAPGSFLICGYLYNEVGYTRAVDELRFEANGSGAGGGSGTGTGPGGGTAAPVNVSPPWVSRAGRKLICHPGSWSNAGRAFGYRWMLDNRVTRVTGARPYAPPHANGHTVRCRVTATGPGGKTTAISRPLRLR